MPFKSISNTGKACVSALHLVSCLLILTSAIGSVVYSQDLRVQRDLQVPYLFDEGTGNTIRDVSGLLPAIDLVIDKPENTSWGDGALRFDSATIAKSAQAATRLNSAVKTSGQISIEAWVAPAKITQTGPAEIVSLSDSRYLRNFGLCQGIKGNDGTFFNIRLGSQNTGNQGNLPANITLTWDAPLSTGSGVATYTIYRNGVVLAEGLTSLSYQDVGLNPDTEYSYSVSAVGIDDSLSSLSTSAQITIDNGSAPPPNGAPTPASERLAAYNIKPDSISLWWIPSVSNGHAQTIRYDIFRDDAIVGCTANSIYVDDGLQAGKDYAYRVVAIENSNPQKTSLNGSISARTLLPPDSSAPPQPTNVTARGVNKDAVLLQWNHAGDTRAESLIAGYRIARDGVELPVLVGERSFLDTGLDIDTTYKYQVSAVDVAGNSNRYTALVRSTPAFSSNKLADATDFAPIRKIVGPSASTVQWGDIDNDGDLDITVADGGKFHDYRGGPPNPRAIWAQTVNDSKKAIASEQSDMVTIGGNYQLASDDIHYTQKGLKAMANDFLREIADF